MSVLNRTITSHHLLEIEKQYSRTGITNTSIINLQWFV